MDATTKLHDVLTITHSAAHECDLKNLISLRNEVQPYADRCHQHISLNTDQFAHVLYDCAQNWPHSNCIFAIWDVVNEVFLGAFPSYQDALAASFYWMAQSKNSPSELAIEHFVQDVAVNIQWHVFYSLHDWVEI